MKQLRLAFLALATVLSLTAQAQLIVKDSLTQEPVPFVSVSFGNGHGSYTDDKGAIIVPNGTDQIRLSHICYEAKCVSVADFGNQTVWLIPKSQRLAEVGVSAKAPKRMKTERVGTVIEKTQTQHRGANGFEMALFIPYDSTWTEPPYIHAILASLDYSTHWLTFATIKTPIYATLRFDLRLPDAGTGAPKDESIIGGGVLCSPDKKIGKEGVRLPLPIPFPETGVFIVVEWITTAAVCESQSLVPALNMALSAKENMTWNKKNFRGMDWTRQRDEPVYQTEAAIKAFKGRTPCAKLGLEIKK